MRNKLIDFKNHVSRHRFAYGVATGMTISGVFVVKRAKEWNEFLIEQGVYDAYYSVED